MKVRLRKYEGCWNDDGKLDGVIGQHCPNVRVVSVGVKKCSFSLLFLIRHAVLFSQSLHHPNSTSSGHSHILATPTHRVLMVWFFFLFKDFRYKSWPPPSHGAVRMCRCVSNSLWT